jgi:hypothetical protein
MDFCSEPSSAVPGKRNVAQLVSHVNEDLRAAERSGVSVSAPTPSTRTPDLLRADVRPIWATGESWCSRDPW